MEFRDLQAERTTDAAASETGSASVAATASAKPARAKKATASSNTIDERRFHVVTDASRDDLLTEFGKDTL